mgnify:CR=1 FL=1
MTKCLVHSGIWFKGVFFTYELLDLVYTNLSWFDCDTSILLMLIMLESIP